MIINHISEEIFKTFPLIDHHCHSVMEKGLSTHEFMNLISESNMVHRFDVSYLDSQLSIAIRKWCAPLLGLEEHAPMKNYINHRKRTGSQEINQKFLHGSGIKLYIIETGHRQNELLPPEDLSVRAQASVETIVRLESIAESIIDQISSEDEYIDKFKNLLTIELSKSIGVKSIAAYRIGLDFDPTPPKRAEVISAVQNWKKLISSQSSSPRLMDPVLIRFGIWEAIKRGAAIQFHVGFGDNDLNLLKSNPLELTDFLKNTVDSDSKIILLHCYPYHREAGYLAHVFPHVYFDIGLSINYLGNQAKAIMREALELGPFSKFLFSTDAWGLSELYYLGAKLFKIGILDCLNSWISQGYWSENDAIYLLKRISHINAQHVYGINLKEIHNGQ